MELKCFESVPCMWQPPGGNGVKYDKFVKFIEEKYKTKIESYWDLHKWSVQNLDKFWYEVWHLADIKCSKIFDQVIDLSVPMSDIPKWFIGAKLNLAENLLRKMGNKVALIAIGEDRGKRVITYAQVYEEVKKYAAAFRKFGLKKGDRIAGYLSNREETFFAMLGANTVGAVWAQILPLLGPQAVLDRLKLIDPSIIVTVDRMRYNQEEIEMLPKVKKISEDLPSLEKFIIVPSKPESVKVDISIIPKSCFLEEFLDIGREKNGTIPDLVFEQMDFSDPIMISYTSGTTGLPKALVQDYGRVMIFLKDHCLLFDSDTDEVKLFYALPGSTIWIISVLGLYTGGTNVLFEGFPFFLSPTYLWDLVEEYKVSTILIFPGVLDEIEKRGYVPTQKHKLSSLSSIFSGAAAVKLQNFDFVYKKIKPGILFAVIYGASEAGRCMAFHRSLPVYKGEVTCPALGMDIQCVDDTGKPVEGISGEIVLAKPVPTFPRILGDIDGTIFREKYFSKFPDKFSFNDIGIINPTTKGTLILCRSDETLKPGGYTISSTEIYNVVNLFPEVHDSICVSQYSKSRKERVALFLKLRKGFKFSDELVKRIERKVEEELTINHVPGLIMEVRDIPYNMNGKKMEILVKKMINKMPYNPEVVINKESLQCFQNIPLYED